MLWSQESYMVPVFSQTSAANRTKQAKTLSLFHKSVQLNAAVSVELCAFTDSGNMQWTTVYHV